MRETARKGLMLTIAGLCLVLAVIGALLPIVQGWIFLLIALFILARELESARRVIKRARRKWPSLSRHIEAARKHRWAPRFFDDFADHTDPDK